MPLFDRRVVLQVEGRDISALRIAFRVERNLRNVPNKAEITVYNLNADTRRLLSRAENARIVLLAGYVDELLQVVFIGSLNRVEHSQTGADWVSKISSGDGRPRSVRVSKSFGREASVGDVLGSLGLSLESAGIGQGNLPEVARSLRTRSIGASGYSISGSADVALDGLLDQQGLEMSIQDEQIQILERGKARQVRAAVLSKDTGLLGSPEVLEKGRIRARSLIAPGLVPGLLVKIESRDLNGFYRVDSSRAQGDTFAKPWWIDIEGRPTT